MSSLCFQNLWELDRWAWGSFGESLPLPGRHGRCLICAHTRWELPGSAYPNMARPAARPSRPDAAFHLRILAVQVRCYAEFLVRDNLPHHDVWGINFFSLSQNIGIRKAGWVSWPRSGVMDNNFGLLDTYGQYALGWGASFGCLKQGKVKQMLQVRPAIK